MPVFNKHDAIINRGFPVMTRNAGIELGGLTVRSPNSLIGRPGSSVAFTSKPRLIAPGPPQKGVGLKKPRLIAPGPPQSGLGITKPILVAPGPPQSGLGIKKTFVPEMPIVATTGSNENSSNMNSLSNFMNGISGSLSFGADQKKVNIVFWIIAGLVLIFTIRPFDFLSRRKRRR